MTSESKLDFAFKQMPAVPGYSPWTMFVRGTIALANRRPYFTLPGYMERGWILKSRWWLPISIRVHHTLRGDHDRHLHDHPAPSMSLIFISGYDEEMPLDQQQSGVADERGETRILRRRPGHLVFRRARDRHRLRMIDGQDCWSLFIMFGHKSQAWGFTTAAGWVWWREYLNQWSGVAQEELERVARRTGRMPRIPEGA